MTSFQDGPLQQMLLAKKKRWGAKHHLEPKKGYDPQQRERKKKGQREKTFGQLLSMPGLNSFVLSAKSIELHKTLSSWLARRGFSFVIDKSNVSF